MEFQKSEMESEKEALKLKKQKVEEAKEVSTAVKRRRAPSAKGKANGGASGQEACSTTKEDGKDSDGVKQESGMVGQGNQAGHRASRKSNIHRLVSKSGGFVLLLRMCGRRFGFVADGDFCIVYLQSLCG